MMNLTPATTDPTPARVERFLTLLNWTTQRLGLQVPPMIDLEQLRSRPPGTFGRAWADHLDAQGLTPFTQGPRRQQLHDGIHVLTGYGTDPLGEAEVQAFLLGCKLRLANGLLLIGLLRGVNRQRQLQIVTLSRADVRSRLRAAYRRGQCSCFDPDHWQPETLWDQPLTTVQGRFGLLE